jgi:hypothetical protein
VPGNRANAWHITIARLIVAFWAFDQPRVADADPGPDRFDRGQRNHGEALRRILRLQALGPTRVKGVSEPVQVFEVIGLGGWERCVPGSSAPSAAG